MNQLWKNIRLSVYAALLILSMVVSQASANPPQVRVNYYYAPAPVFAPAPTVTYYAPAPTTVYYQPVAPVFPAVTYYQPSYSFYAQPAPVMTYYPPAPVSSVTTYYHRGILFPRTTATTTTYYTPGFFRY